MEGSPTLNSATTIDDTKWQFVCCRHQCKRSLQILTRANDIVTSYSTFDTTVVKPRGVPPAAFVQVDGGGGGCDGGGRTGSTATPR